MVNFAKSALVAVLAATASAEHHRFGRRHMHPRGYVASPPPTEPSTVPEAGESTSAYHTVPAPHPTTEPAGVTSSAPYGYGNTTVPVGSGTGVTTEPEVPVSTVVVIPLPETTPVEGGDKPTGGNGYPTGEVPTGGNGQPTGELPTGGQPETTPSPGEGEGGEEVCGPATVTVTVTESTVYVTKGKSSAPVEAPSSVPEVETSAPAPTHPVDTPKPETTPVASETESKPEYPTAPQVPEVPATTPVESESEAPAPPTPKPETSAVHSAPVASSSKVSSEKPKPTYTPTTGKKRGIIYQETSDLSSIGDETCGWAWNWNSNNFGQDKSWNYVPILNTPDKASEFSEQVGKALSSAPEGSKYVMGLNEPDQVGGGGSGVDVGTAVSNYLEHIAPLAKTGAKLGSISVTSDQSGDLKGLTYLEAWKKGCDEQGGCPVDFVCLHYYGNPSQSGAQQAEEFITYMKGAIKKVHELWDSSMPIWLTEFSALPFINEDTEGKNIDFMNGGAIKYLEDEPSIERYAYYMASPGYMIEDSGSLTPAGEAYLSS